MKNKDFKRNALFKLKGNWGKAILYTFIFVIIVLAIASLFFIPRYSEKSKMFFARYYFHIHDIEKSNTEFSPRFLEKSFWIDMFFSKIVFRFYWIYYSLSFIIFPALILGMNMFFLDVSRKKLYKFNTVFSGFKSSWGKSILTYVLMNIYRFLWYLLFIIPAIIKSFSYSMTFYILIDNPDISANEAITRSKNMMKGYKWKLFCLHLSFIGWYFLCFLSLGIGLLWLMPYVSSSVAEFYLYVSSEYEAKNRKVVEA